MLAWMLQDTLKKIRLDVESNYGITFHLLEDAFLVFALAMFILIM